MHGHLVPVEVGVERCADQRVKLNRFTFDQHGLECLDAKTVQWRRTVQQDRMLANDFFENVPDLSALTLDESLGSLDRRRFAAKLQLRENEGLEELQRHFLRQATLMQLQRRSYYYHRATRIIYSLPK